MTNGVSVALLGPLEISVDEHVIVIPGRKQRELAAALALNANQVVAVASLVDVLWGETAPDRAEHTLQQHVSSLRKLLDSSDEPLLVTRSPGYLLRVADLDVDAFEQTAASGFAAAEVGNWSEARTAFQHAARTLAGSGTRERARVRSTVGRRDPTRRAAAHRVGGVARGTPRMRRCAHCDPGARTRRRGIPIARRAPGVADARAVSQRSPGRRVDCVSGSASRSIDELGIEPGTELRELEQAILLQRSDLGVRTTGSMRELHATFRADTRTSVGRIELPDGQAVLLMAGVIAIGRDADSVVRLVDNRVSRHHAEIHVDDTTATVRDLGSTNGTSVNGDALLQDHVLRDGDVLSVGGVELRFRADASSH